MFVQAGILILLFGQNQEFYTKNGMGIWVVNNFDLKLWQL
jgi:hypothetical protein